MLSLAMFASPAHAADPSTATLEQKMDTLSLQLDSLIEKYNTARVELTATQRKIAKLTAEIRPLQVVVDSTAARVGEFSNAAYKGGQASAMNAMLTSGSPTALMEQLIVLDQLARSQTAAVQNVTTAKARLDVQKARLDELARQQSAQQQALAGTKATVEKQISQLQEMRRTTIAGASQGRIRPESVPYYIPDRRGKVVRFAYAQLGKPYVFGAEGPGAFDCSGITKAAWVVGGVYLTHSAHIQYTEVVHVSRSQMREGDLVFYYTPIHHVGIYVGNGYVIHAPQPGDVVKKMPIDRVGPVSGIGRPA